MKMCVSVCTLSKNLSLMLHLVCDKLESYIYIKGFIDVPGAATQLFFGSVETGWVCVCVCECVCECACMYVCVCVFGEGGAQFLRQLCLSLSD